MKKSKFGRIDYVFQLYDFKHIFKGSQWHDIDTTCPN